MTLTENAQPALVAVSLAAMRVLEAEAGVDLARDAKFVAGHSVGEYSALAAAGALTLADAVRLVRIRGRAMQQAVPVGVGAMAALLGVDFEQAAAIAAEAAQGEIVQAANDNGGGQVVVSGHKAAVERAVEIAKAKGVRRAMLLPVSAPFHSALMQPAAEVMAEALAKVDGQAAGACRWSPMCWREPVTDPAEIVRGLVAQVTGTVRWRESVAFMAAAGVTTFYEVGSGKVLVRPGQADRRGRDRRVRSARRTTSPRSRLRAADRKSCEECVHVRSDRQDRARHRRDRRHRRRDRARAASAGRDRGALRHAARGARRSSPASLKERVHVLPCNLADKDAVEALVPQGGRGHGQARHPGRQCRHHARQSVRAAERRGLGRGDRGQPDGHLPAGARRGARA